MFYSCNHVHKRTNKIPGRRSRECSPSSPRVFYHPSQAMSCTTIFVPSCSTGLHQLHHQQRYRCTNAAMHTLSTNDEYMRHIPIYSFIMVVVLYTLAVVFFNTERGLEDPSFSSIKGAGI
jgi:hypothetical protein